MIGTLPIAYTVASPDCSAPVPLGYAAPFPRALAELAEIGYDGVEIQVQRPERIDAAALREQVHEHGLSVAAIATGPLNYDGAALTSPLQPDRRRMCDRLIAAARLAGQLNAPLTLGRARGRLIGTATTRQYAWAVEAIRSIADAAQEAATRLLLEPQEPATTNLITCYRDARALVERLNHRALALVLDTHHMNAVGDDPSRAVRAAGTLVAEIQLAGAKRGPLDPNSPSLTRLLSALHQTGFNSWLVMEHAQTPDSRTAARQSLECMKALGYR